MTAAQTAPTQAPDTPTSPLSPAASSLSGATSPPWPSSAPVASQLAPAPAETVRRFADWELTCVKPAETNENSTSGANTVANGVNEKPPASDVARSACRVSQRLAVKGTSETVFMVSVLPAKQPGLEAAIISTPLGGYLAPGMELKIDNGRPVRLLYETCNQAGCHVALRCVSPPGSTAPRYEMIEENWVRFAKINFSRIIQNANVFCYLTRGPSQPSVDGLNFGLYVDGHFFPDSRKS